MLRSECRVSHRRKVKPKNVAVWKMYLKRVERLRRFVDEREATNLKKKTHVCNGSLVFTTLTLSIGSLLSLI
jgi:hypothetical protein